jgi:predicted HAD superfamily Cof-like phosphohydrolase
MGVDVPDKPVVPSDDRLVARCKLLLEEVMEFVEAAGIEVRVPDIAIGGRRGNAAIKFEYMEFSKTAAADLVGMADGLADTMVICAGGMAICGIADLPLLREVDDNNLLKLDTGYFDAERGKFIKAKNHPKPDITKVLKAQGWENEDVHVPCGSH